MLRDLGSRDIEFIGLVKDIRDELVELGQVGPDEYTAVLMQGSGTFGLEAVVSSTVPPDGKLLVIINGAYGKRLARSASVLKIDTVTLSLTYFDKLESVIVPIDIRTAIGLGQLAAKTEPGAGRTDSKPPMPIVIVGPRARPALPIVIQGTPETLGPVEARKEFHRRAARVVGALNLPSDVIKDLLLREKH